MRAADDVTAGLAIPFTAESGGAYALGKDLGFFAEENIAVKTIVFLGAGVLAHAARMAAQGRR